jgi:hypothetical protein
MNPWIKQNIDAPPPRFSLGLWLPYRKLASVAYVPTRRERARLLNGQFYGVVIQWTLPAFGTDYFKGVAPGWFRATHFCCSSFAFAGGNTSQIMLYDPVRKIQFMDSPVMAQSFGAASGVTVGNARRPFFLKHPYLFEPRTPILAQIGNLTQVANQGQVVVYGYIVDAP